MPANAQVNEAEAKKLVDCSVAQVIGLPMACQPRCKKQTAAIYPGDGRFRRFVVAKRLS